MAYKVSKKHKDDRIDDTTERILLSSRYIDREWTSQDELRDALKDHSLNLTKVQMAEVIKTMKQRGVLE